MIRIFFFIVIFMSCSPSFGEDTQSTCVKTWAKSDLKEFFDGPLERLCSLATKDGKHALELVRYNKGCQRYEHTPKTDCIFVRECGGEVEEQRVSPAVFNQKSFLDSLCSRGAEPYILLEDGHFQNSTGLKSHAYIDCQKSKKGSFKIVLKVNGKTKVCQESF